MKRTPRHLAKKRKTRDTVEVEIFRQLKEVSATTSSLEDTDEEYLFGRTVAFTLKRL